MTEVFDAGEMFRVLSDHHVAYVTIGGMAIQAHGGQRFTQDLDVAVASSTENYAALAAALIDLDARILGPDGERSKEAPGPRLLEMSDQWHLTTRFGFLDVVTVPFHLGSFDRMRKRALEVELGDLVVPIASREDLLIFKRAAGRPQDLADIELLESLPGPDGPGSSE